MSDQNTGEEDRLQTEFEKGARYDKKKRCMLSVPDLIRKSMMGHGWRAGIGAEQDTGEER
jgi:hypothetical protein